MSILIKGMEMPKSCLDCRFCNGQANTDYGVCVWCDVDGKVRDAYTMQDCPLVPIPPHGRLIDADAIPYKKIMYDKETDAFYYGVTKPYIDRMSTVIPADKDGEDDV